jgi:hypothetical protein
MELTRSAGNGNRGPCSSSAVFGGHRDERGSGEMKGWLLRGAKIGAITGAPVGLTYALASYSAWRSWGSRGLLALAIYALMLTAILAVVTPLAALPMLLFKRTRGAATAVVAASAVCLCTFLPALWATARVDEAGILDLIARGAPVVDAILRYEADSGHPPVSLEALIPTICRRSLPLDPAHSRNGCTHPTSRSRAGGGPSLSTWARFSLTSSTCPTTRVSSTFLTASGGSASGRSFIHREGQRAAAQQ